MAGNFKHYNHISVSIDMWLSMVYLWPDSRFPLCLMFVSYYLFLLFNRTDISNFFWRKCRPWLNIYAYRIKILLFPQFEFNQFSDFILYFGSLFLKEKKKKNKPYLAVLSHILILLFHLHLGKSFKHLRRLRLL